MFLKKILIKVIILLRLVFNHNGDIDLAKELIRVSHQTGFDAVKFQKRVPEAMCS